MNLIFRMIKLLIASFFKSRLLIDKPKNSLTLRVLPNDLDLNLHMNNGRYLTICDLSRVDMFIRTGLARTMLKEKWQPVITEHTMTYKKPLTLFQKYDVKMEITDWDDRVFYMTHTFIVGDKVVAEGRSKGAVIGAVEGKKRKGIISPEAVMDKVNHYTAGKAIG